MINFHWFGFFNKTKSMIKKALNFSTIIEGKVFVVANANSASLTFVEP